MEEKPAEAAKKEEFHREAAEDKEITYSVLPQDTLTGIAMKHDVSIYDLKRRNHLASDLIFPGMKLYIPRKKAKKAKRGKKPEPPQPQEDSKGDGVVSYIETSRLCVRDDEGTERTYDGTLSISKESVSFEPTAHKAVASFSFFLDDLAFLRLRRKREQTKVTKTFYLDMFLVAGRKKMSIITLADHLEVLSTINMVIFELVSYRLRNVFDYRSYRILPPIPNELLITTFEKMSGEKLDDVQSIPKKFTKHLTFENILTGEAGKKHAQILKAGEEKALDTEPKKEKRKLVWNFEPDPRGKMTYEMYQKIRKHIKDSRLSFYEVRLAYASTTDGFSMSTFYNCLKEENDFILLVWAMDHDDPIGAFLPFKIRPKETFYGTYDCFIFTFEPEFKVYNTTGANEMYFYSDRKKFALGGPEEALAVRDLKRINLGKSETFGNEKLLQSKVFFIEHIEVWCFTFDT